MSLSLVCVGVLVQGGGRSGPWLSLFSSVTGHPPPGAGCWATRLCISGGTPGGHQELKSTLLPCAWSRTGAEGFLV